MRITKAIVSLLVVTSLVGCASRTYEPTGVSHPNGVVFYDQDGNLHPAKPESVSPESQDNWQTTGAVLTGLAAVAGLAVGIVSLTK